MGRSIPLSLNAGLSVETMKHALVVLSEPILYLPLALLGLYLLVYFYRSYRVYQAFLYYLESEDIMREMKLKRKPSLFFFLSPRIHQVYVSRIIELELFYEFVGQAGLDLSSVRRDYFSYTKGGVSPEVVEVET